MRKLLVLLGLLPVGLFAQLTDNFSDGDFTANPAWSGETSKWQVNSGILQSNSSIASDTFHLATPSTAAVDAQWEVFVKLDFQTSSNNWLDIYLISDNANLELLLNGYFVRIGNTNDEISLYRRNGATITEIIDGLDGRSEPSSSNNQFKIKVTRSVLNVWTLYDDNAGGSNYFVEGQTTDATFLTSSYFGFSIKQSTASFFNKHYIDDIYAGPLIQDSIPPTVTLLNALSSTQLDLKFSEAAEQTTAETIANYSVNNGIGNPSSAFRDGSDFSLVHLTFASPFLSGVENTITINNVSDFASNSIAANSTATFTYYQTEQVEGGDVVINEVLFHAETDGKEFVELYNRSNKYLDLRDIYFYDASVSNPLHPISSSRRVFLPGEYLAITEDPSDVISRYFVENHSSLIEISNLPSLTDDSDTVRISKSSGELLDKLVYFEDWQFPLLNSTAGISLERLNPARPTQDSTNWHSAAENVRATPGYKNSQYSDANTSGNEVEIEPEVFSPDEDGKDDNVNIHFHFSAPGGTATVQVFDAKGRLIRRLISNQLIGNDGTFSWDGLTDKKEKARIGIYIFYVEVFNLQGDTKNYKRTCVLASKL
jgi:hypothetical protein